MAPSNPPDSPLSLLPTELLALIVNQCHSDRDVAAWSQTNRTYYSTVGHLLYLREQWRPVFWAAQHGRVATLRRWLSIHNPDGSTRGNLDVYRSYPDANGKRCFRYTPGHLGTYRSGLRFELDSPIHQAARHGHTDVVEFLLDHGGADVDAPSRGVTPHGLSVFRDARDCDRPLDADCVAPAALHVAIVYGQAAVAEALLRRGADPRIPARGGGPGAWHSAGPGGAATALHLAAAFGVLPVLRALAGREDLDVNGPDAFGQPPLLYAAECPPIPMNPQTVSTPPSSTSSPGGAQSGPVRGPEARRVAETAAAAARAATDPPGLVAMDVLVRELGADPNIGVRSPDGVIDAPLLRVLILGIRWRAAARLVGLGARVDPELLDVCEVARMSAIHPNVPDFDALRELVEAIRTKLGMDPDPKGRGWRRSMMGRVLMRNR